MVIFQNKKKIKRYVTPEPPKKFHLYWLKYVFYFDVELSAKYIGSCNFQSGLLLDTHRMAMQIVQQE